MSGKYQTLAIFLIIAFCSVIQLVGARALSLAVFPSNLTDLNDLQAPIRQTFPIPNTDSKILFTAFTLPIDSDYGKAFWNAATVANRHFVEGHEPFDLV